ncbi:major facilitator superfamily [Cordyceps militaris CM01]|uniref:Major facilitator superfamily n=1 Tax=Cordyceps militaris (strain CM01) TaxID=983644 RepID=G3JRK4_CORMM|nr:major facilitator superfamily [Cordyceps militaris CM01]EGX88607.1 major facilitator superfamily [Cordyceps militaris CM01]
MSGVLQSAQWLYAEFGARSMVAAGPDAWLIVLSRTCRMFAFGAISLIFALFLSALNYSDARIGLFMSTTMAGDVVLGLLVTLIADRFGRRRVLLGGSVLMIFSGLVFVAFENYWVLLLAAVVGVVSATGGDFGPFRSVEESTLSHLTSSSIRADVLSWYVTSSSLGSAVGTEISGRIIKAIKGTNSITAAYHAMFWVYVAAGAICAAAAGLMSKRSEIYTEKQEESSTSQAAEPLLELPATRPSDVDNDESGRDQEDLRAAYAQASPGQKSRLQRVWRKGLQLGHVSPESRGVVVKLWILLTIDSLADGMVSYGLTNYYLARKFDLSESYLGDIMSICYLLAAISTIFAGPLARRLGLINTMVFTHLPSSVAVLLFPIPQSVWMTIALLFVRTGLNNMDQAPRAAFIAAVVKPAERTAVMGITSTLRTLAATVGPSLTGFLADSNGFWIAYVVAGLLRIGYDVGLFYMFVGIDVSGDQEVDKTDAASEVESDRDDNVEAEQPQRRGV